MILRAYAPEECGPDGYPLAWHETIKHQIRAEAGDRCIRCGHPYRVGLHKGGVSPCDDQCRHGGVSTWRILTVHHLDGDKRNCRWWNLVALCQRCHLRVQTKVRLSQVWPWEHSEWFKPFAAGYYAWSYLGEDLSREQTMERLEALLALERI